MKEEFEKLVMAGKIKPADVDPLVELATSGFCMHRSWGFGKITTVDTVVARLAIDFESKAGHEMDLSFAVSSLKAIPQDHILARKLTDLQALQQMAALNHLDLIKVVLQSYGGQATLEQIQTVLVPDVIADDWKKWWDTAKREMKKDGHFQLPVKKTAPIVFHEEEVSTQDRLLQEFDSAKGLKAKIGVASEIEKSVDELTDKAMVGSRVVEGLNKAIGTHQRTQPVVTMEGIFIREDIRAVCGVPRLDGELVVRDIWEQGHDQAEFISQLPGAKQKRAVIEFKEAYPDNWVEPVLNMLNEVSAKLCGECASVLIDDGKLDELKEVLARLINQHQAGTELLLWLSKSRSDAYADILGPEVFRAMITAIERDQFNEKKSIRLSDFIMGDMELLGELIESADVEVIKDLTRALKMSGAFDDMDKRSLYARIVKLFPSVQSLISGEKAEEQMPLLALPDYLIAKEKEYDDLVNRKMPANRKEIAIARSYGDLRENSEYKYAKEQQRLLQEFKAKLEADLGRVRAVQLNTVDTSAVTFGTKISVKDLDTNATETYKILGPWESNPDADIISYQAPLGQAMVNKKVGDEITFEPDPSMRRRFKIESIELVNESEVPAPNLDFGSSDDDVQPGEATDEDAKPKPAAAPAPEAPAAE